ncbi:MAG: acetolactate synthase catalytic subunit [Alphaproteobacteria bacterium]|nr:acetolactate synthase catalytic subunit [Alphaproteobacteria bacterium]
MPPSNATVAQALAAALQRHGVTVAFGQSIPSAFHIAAPAFGIRQVGYRTENAGGAMADGYARVSGKVAVVTAQNGPAAALLVAPLAEALKASAPVVALVQDIARPDRDRNAFQELDHFALFSGVAKWVRRVDLASRLDDYVDMAFAAAASGRPGPAVLLLPFDLLNEPEAAASTASGRRAASLGRFPLDRSAPDPERVEAAADLIAGAAHPLIVAGGGVHLSGAAAALAALQRTAALPVATTPMGKGAVDETDPLSLGVIGYFMGPNGATRPMKPLLDRADVVLFAGARTNQNGTDSWRLFPTGARFIHIDVDGQEIGRNYEALRLQGDAKLALEALAAALVRRDLAKRHAGASALRAAVAAARARHLADTAALRASPASPIRPERLMAEIDAQLRPDDVVVADASYATVWTANYLTARAAGQRFVTPRGIAGIGWGLPMALGAKAALPDRRVLCVVGDGGFAHCWAEMETALRMALPVALVVLNNGILGFQKHAELVRWGAHSDAVQFSAVDHAAIARACGCTGIRVEEPAAIAPALRQALAADRLTVLDVMVARDAYPPLGFYEGKIERFV